MRDIKEASTHKMFINTQKSVMKIHFNAEVIYIYIYIYTWYLRFPDVDYRNYALT